MTFLILSTLSGIALVVLPIVAVLKLRNRWKLPKGLFLKAGMAALMVEIIHAAVLGNGTSLWPQLLDLPAYAMAIIFGVVSGLFTELGRFLILDKLMKKVRGLHEGLMFALGWGGLQTILYGAVVVFGVIGMYMISGVSNIATILPDADKSQLTAFTEIQKQSNELMNGNPILGLAPVIERGSLIMIDIALTLLIILGLIEGKTSNTWLAVGFRTLVTASVLYANSWAPLAGEFCLILFGLAAYLMSRKLSSVLNEAIHGKGYVKA